MRTLAVLALCVAASANLLQGCAAVVVAGAASGAVVAHDRRTTGRFIDDQSLELKAGKLVTDDSALEDKVRIKVTSINGIVLLTGEAPTPELRDRVLLDVRKLDGIRRVYDHVRIAELASFGSISHDRWVYTKLKSKQTFAKDVDPTRIKVVTSDSVVYLMGLVTHAEADAATKIAQDTDGVTRVVRLFEYID